MKIKVNGKFSKDYFVLGVATNKGNTQAASEKMAKSWAPKNAKSFNINISHTDYKGRNKVSVETETGYADISAFYFTTKKEGKHLI